MIADQEITGEDKKSFHVNVPQVLHQTIDNEAIIVDLGNGNYYSLERVGAEIWLLLTKGASIGEIISLFAKRYTSRHAEIAQGVRQLVAELGMERLIVPSNDAGGSVKHPLSLENDAQIPFATPVLYKFTDMQELLLMNPIHEVEESGWPYSLEMAHD